MLTVFGWFSAVLSLVAVVPYIRDIFRLSTKPERASWLIWSVLGLIAFFSQLAKGATDSLWLTAGQTVAVLSVFLLSLRYGVGGLSRRDGTALLVAAVGLIIWFLTKEAAYALFIVIVIDAIGTFLTVMKSCESPASETLSTWIISGTSGIFGALALAGWNFILAVYPLYIVIANYAVAIAILIGRKKHPEPVAS